MTSTLRKWLVVLATLFALAVPAVQAATGWGLSAGEFAANGGQTLRAAPYAFAIWGLIYAALVAHAVVNVVASGRDGALLDGISPATVAVAGCGAWLLASGADARWASVAIILAAAAFAAWALYRVRAPRRLSLSAAAVIWPIALLGGWLLIAAVINVLTVATAEGLITPSSAPGVAAVAVIVAVGATAAIVRLGVSAVYALPVAWGLIAVFVAERDHRPADALLALGGAALVALVSCWTGWRRSAPGQPTTDTVQSFPSAAIAM